MNTSISPTSSSPSPHSPHPPASPTSSLTQSQSAPAHNTLNAALHAHKQTYIDGAGAIVLFFVSTMLIFGLQRLTASMSDFPAPILAMVLVAAVMILAAQFIPSIDAAYARYLRGPTDLLNRHMSVGFTVPFTMIMKEPMPSPQMVGLIIGGYIITGVLNAVLAYAAAFGTQLLLLALPLPVFPSLRLPGCSSRGCNDVAPTQLPLAEQERAPEKTDNRIQSYISDSTTLWQQSPTGRGSPASRSVLKVGTHVAESSAPQPKPTEPAANRIPAVLTRAACFAAANPLLCASLAGVVLVGVPVAAVTGRETALDVFVLVGLWTGTLVIQAAVGGAGRRDRNPWRPVFAALCNAVLWSSLGNMAYLAAKAAARHHATADVLAIFHGGTTLADRIYVPSGSALSSLSFGAGDLAVSILDAGIVSWGLKLFECRAQLLSRAGATTLAVGAALAIANLVCWPVTVHTMGLAPASRALAFAARSVTLALAGPAMARLGGDVGLNAAMVVFNGIIFQVVMGLVDGVRATTATSPKTNDMEAATPRHDIEATAFPPPCTTPRRGSNTSSGGDTLAESITAAPASALHAEVAKPKEAVTIAVVHLRGGDAGHADTANSTAASADAPATVALGVTVGINAAAMGTAYLYENAGRAAPYAALSMTVFGVMTVVFVSIQSLAGWVVLHSG